MADWNRYFAMSYLERPEEMMQTIVCREMKWTWQEFQQQPQWLINEIMAYMIAESKTKENQK